MMTPTARQPSPPGWRARRSKHAPPGGPGRARPGRPRARGQARRWRSDRGAGAAEIVIAVPLLMLLILLIVQFAIWAHASSVAQATAEEALAAARVQGGSAAAGQQRAQQVLGQIGSSVLISPQVSVTRTATTTTVQITGTAEDVLPVPGLALPVHITVTGPVERFVPATEQG
jgi:Flp pilus assembly protein TadG